MAVHIPRVPCRPMPDDFPHVAPTMSMTELRRHYRCGADTVSRWCSECGVEYKGKRKAGEKRVGRKPRKCQAADSRAVIEACLTCPLDVRYCRGQCIRMEMIRAKELAEKEDGRQSRASKRRLWIMHRFEEGYDVPQLARFCGMKDISVRRIVFGTPPVSAVEPLPPLESRRDEWESLR